MLNAQLRRQLSSHDRHREWPSRFFYGYPPAVPVV